MNKQTYDSEEKDPFAPLKARKQWVCWQYQNKGKKKWMG